MYLKPKAGRSVPDPERGGLLAPEGREVELTQYWQRRIQDDDVEEGQPQAVNDQPVASAKTAAAASTGE